MYDIIFDSILILQNAYTSAVLLCFFMSGWWWDQISV